MLASAWESLRNNLQEAHDLMARVNYGMFTIFLNDRLSEHPDLNEEERNRLVQLFPEPQAQAARPAAVSGEEEDFAEGVLDYPPDTLPLAMHDDHGWVDDFGIEALCNDRVYHKVQQNVGISDPQVIKDIEQNTLHILGRCNDPRAWEENRQGLVYGMVQSGKTASMMNLIAMGRAAGYRLFILLAGDKSSLRNQSQQRINEAFDLTNGWNNNAKIHSPTFRSDFNDTNMDYMGTFQMRRIKDGEDVTNIIVIKKETNHLPNLISQIQQAQRMIQQYVEHPAIEVHDHAALRCMILDDEADAVSQDTNPRGGGSTIHGHICGLRETIEQNCYVAYTATPQACLSAHPDDPIGYPKDFFWLLEPYQDEHPDGSRTNRSYLGAYDVFWEEDHLLIDEIRAEEWPVYRKTPDGQTEGVAFPRIGGGVDLMSEGENAQQDAAQLVFLQSLRDGVRPIPSSLHNSLMDFAIGCCVRWWSHWKTKHPNAPFPSVSDIERTYPHHAVMVHLSRLAVHQRTARTVTETAWKMVKQEILDFDISDLSSGPNLRDRWARQDHRINEYRSQTNRPDVRLEEALRFVYHVIEIVEKPIRNDREQGYPFLRGHPYIYLVNSDTADGMRLYYDDQLDPPELLTKRAAIIVGGQILSRGLTIKGLSVSFFGRTAKMPMGDSVLQMGRWFGHKRQEMDLLQIYMPEGVKVLFRDIAIADMELRRQIKDAILKGLTPMNILLELRNSPQFRATSPSKSTFVTMQSGSSFSGKRALLYQPRFVERAIRENAKRLERFEREHRGIEMHGRAKVYRDVPVVSVIGLFEDMKCDVGALNSTFADYARYLKDWVDGAGAAHPRLPAINVAVMNGIRRRKRVFSTSRPRSPEEARESAQGRFDKVTGGRTREFLGDDFIDRDPQWHLDNPSPNRRRTAGEDILIVLYRFDPNYLTNKLWNGGAFESVGRVFLQPGDPMYIDPHQTGVERCYALSFLAITPAGGPMYGIGVNSALDSSGILQVGMDEIVQEDTDDVGNVS